MYQEYCIVSLVFRAFDLLVDTSLLRYALVVRVKDCSFWSPFSFMLDLNGIRCFDIELIVG
jgi:hypothetical protein